MSPHGKIGSAPLILRVLSKLDDLYPDAAWNPRDDASPFQVLVLTILSAQTTDRAVDSIRETLFSRYRTAGELASAQPTDVESIIRPTGYYHAKARHIIAAARVVTNEFGGVVPDTMEELLRIPGVGRKTANIVLFHSFGKNDGIAVDTHVRRVAHRLGWTNTYRPDQIERDLMALVPREGWGHLTDLLIAHGRRLCMARKPRCSECPVRQHCRFGQEKAGEVIG